MSLAADISTMLLAWKGAEKRVDEEIRGANVRAIDGHLRAASAYEKRA